MRVTASGRPGLESGPRVGGRAWRCATLMKSAWGHAPACTEDGVGAWVVDGGHEPRLEIRFCAAGGGVLFAYGRVGNGPPLIAPPAWISHLELSWQDPAVRAFLLPLAARRTVVLYDKPGCGL